ncbi:MAG: tetratricopeptide repeat protein [Proteobacteria bacterium]|nr:tetratricopeptide repeat protein [Pseudomonadota bacterium]
MTELNTLPDELILNIHSKDKTVPENLSVTLGGREVSQTAFAFTDDEFIQKLAQLEKMTHLPLPCDPKGAMGAKENALESAIYEQAILIGTGLAEVLDDMGRLTLTEIMNSTKIPLLRIVVDGDWADRVLALPWELLYIDGRFPVKEARLDVVREVSVANAPGLKPQTKPFRVLVHIAAPEDDEGQSSLMYEEEAYRLVLSMQQAAKDAVVFSDLGTVRDLVRAIQSINPTVVHFTGHGSPGKLLFENETGENVEIPISDLLKEMRAFAVDGQHGLPQVFYLASSYGASGMSTFATTLQKEGCPAVVAYMGPAGDQLSTQAEVAFYGGLAAGKRLTESMRSARLFMAGVLGEKDHCYRYPLGWAQLVLYLRGNDTPISKGKAAADNIYVLEQELHRSESPVYSLDMMHSGIDGFIGRRKDLATLRQSHIKGQRVFVLYGLGGIGKTSLAVKLIPKLGIEHDKIVVLDAARANKAANPVQDLWEQMTDQLQDAFPDILVNILETHKQNQDPKILLGEMITAIKEPWLIYLDNAESLQIKTDSENSDLGAWASSEIEKWWQIAVSGAVYGGPLTLIATTRYLLKELERKDNFQVGLLRPSEIERMMRWFPYLRQIPHAHKKKIIKWLNGHARTMIYLEGLFKEIFDPLTSEDDISDARWQAAIKDALPQTDEKSANEDLMLSHIWKRLDDTARDQLRILTTLRCPAPMDAVKTFGNQTQRLESLGLISKYSGKFYGMQDSVSCFAEKLCGFALPKDHLCIGLWYKEAFKTEKRLVFAEEAVYHLVKAGKADVAAPTAADLVSHYYTTSRYAESGKVLDSVIALSPVSDLAESLLSIRGNLHNALGRYELAAADYQEIIESARKRETAGIAEVQGLHGLANALYNLGQYEESAEAYNKSLVITKQVYGTETHSSYAASLHGLADVLDRLGRYKEAVEAYNKSLVITKQVYETETRPEYAVSLHGLAGALDRLGRYKEAVEAYNKSLVITKQVYETEVRPEYVSLLNGLAGALYNLGRYEEAVETYNKSLVMTKQVYGTEVHPEYASSLHGLANALDHMSRYEEAFEAYNKSLVIKKQIYKTEVHPEYTSSLYGLAVALVHLARHEEAVEAFNKSLVITRQVYGTVTHPEYASSLAGLANTLVHLGRNEEAVEAYNKSLNIKKEIYGSDEHPSSLPTRTNLSMTLAKMGQIDQACREMDQSLSIARIMGHPFHTGNVLYLYAQLESDRNAQKALDMAIEAEFLLKQVFDASHPTLQGAQAVIAKLKGGLKHEPEPDSEHKNQKAKVTPEMLKDWTYGLLYGISSVSKVVFVHLAQRMALLISTQGILTQLAVTMGRPGLELENPTALEMPENMPSEQIKDLRPRLAGFKALVKRVAEDIKDILQDCNEQNGRIVLHEDLSHPVPDELQTVLLDEAAAIILAGSDELLLAELDLVLKGLSILLKDVDDPAAIGLPTTLLRRLPDQRDKIVNTLKPFCSEIQKKLLLETIE